MYKSYKAYMGRKTIQDPDEDLDTIIAGINERGEKIILATNVIEGYYILIITESEINDLMTAVRRTI